MADYRFATFWTNELAYLISCIETASYGESEGAFRASQYDKIGALRDISVGDRVFLRFRDKLLSGPFIVSEPHEQFVIDKSVGQWHKVNLEKTPKEYHPVWLFEKPWCFFFDLSLASQVNYSLFTALPKQFSNLPPTDFIPPDLGDSLWKHIEEFGNPFTDFLQRQGSKVRFRAIGSLPPSSRQSVRSFSQNDNPVFTGNYKTKTGARVRSKSEKLIADSLHDHGFRFEYEKTLTLDGYVIHPDFCLSDYDLIIEHLGLIDRNPDYQKNWEWRKRLYDKHGKNYITTTESDITDLDKNLMKKLAVKGCKPSV